VHGFVEEFQNLSDCIFRVNKNSTVFNIKEIMAMASILIFLLQGVGFEVGVRQ